jgi:TseV toxin immunity protein TsiV
MAPEDPDYLRNAAAELDADLRVTQDGRVICCVGLLATLYFADGGAVVARQRLADAFEIYLRTARAGLVWAGSSNDPRYLPVQGSSAMQLRSWMGGVPPDKAVTFKLHGGKEADDASPWFVRAMARSLPPNELSYLSFGLPFAWLADHAPAAFTRLVVEVCDALAPTHGYAGLAAIGSLEVRRSDPEFGAMIALVSRFRGLEIDLPQSHSIYLAEENRIKAINWLTVLEQSWIDRLGGRDALGAGLGKGIELHPFRTGVVIQAGPRPLLGDVNRNEPMEAYSRVARALKPIRIQSVRGIASDHGFTRDRSDQWLARFE